MITATRYHDISCGHRVVGHEGKCRHLHGHNYRIHFTCRAPGLDALNRVIDFSVMKSKLCMWLEDAWDHRFLAWEKDSLMLTISEGYYSLMDKVDAEYLRQSIVWLPFNPTAEALADYLLHIIGPMLLKGTNVDLIKVVVEETRKCSAEASAWPT